MDPVSFGPVRQIDAGPLDVGYVEVGPATGQPVLLLHGWPYDIHSYAEAAPALGAAGYRVVVPYLRGYGTTRIRSDAGMRNGQQAALAVDVIDLMDALGIESAIVAGFDWGARSADIVAALWPDRCNALVAVSGYLIGNQAADSAPLPPPAELSWWYQFYFATERGRTGYGACRRDFARLIWHTASPGWAFDDETFDRSAASFDNPDHVAIVIHNYRWRLGLAAGEPRYDDLERRRYEQRLADARREQQNPEWIHDYRSTRPKVERKLGHLMRRKHGGRRARVRRRRRVDADFNLLAAAHNLARLAVLGLRSTITGWAVITP